MVNVLECGAASTAKEHCGDFEKFCGDGVPRMRSKRDPEVFTVPTAATELLLIELVERKKIVYLLRRHDTQRHQGSCEGAPGHSGCYRSCVRHFGCEIDEIQVTIMDHI